ncbi:MAG: glycosyltransferase family 4 protein [Thermodesulfobacteriota bacterium]
MSSSKYNQNIKVAWLLPSMARGYVWQPVFREFTRLFPKSTVFTGQKPVQFSQNDKLPFNLKIVGKFRFLKLAGQKSTYDRGIILPPMNIPFHLLKFRPKIIFAAGFSLWTMISIIMKPLMRWKIIIIYDGSSPEIDVKDSWIRTIARRLMTKVTDAFITNTKTGKSYLVEFLYAKNEQVFARPYQVADKKFLTDINFNIKEVVGDIKHPVFLYIGLIIKRKGIDFLLKACAELNKRGHKDYTLLIVGNGPEREELETFIKEKSIENQVKWVGWVEYNNLGQIFNFSDIFILPTLEDIWGIVVTEAMIFGKPVLCSRLAGAWELVVDGENGYTFDPTLDKPEILADRMSEFVEKPELADSMGEKSKEYISYHTPEAVAQHLKKVVGYVSGESDISKTTFPEHSKKYSNF